ncbi:MAG: transcription factor S [Theionarchaea archaeon]|nr:transcription factor S [Theionarchaea archaeon]
MEFCPECGGLLMPKDGLLQCRCGYSKKIGKEEKEHYTLQEKPIEPREILVIEEEIQQMPTAKMECRKCGNTEAYYWMLQTRSADEPATKFFRCTKCKYTWREYD